MATITIDLSQEGFARIAETARQQGITPTEMARQCLERRFPYDPKLDHTFDLPYGFYLQYRGMESSCGHEAWRLCCKLLNPDRSVADTWDEPPVHLTELETLTDTVCRRMEALLSEHYSRLMNGPGGHLAKAGILTGHPPDDPEPEPLGPDWWNSKTTPDNLQLPNRCRQVLLGKRETKAWMGRWSLSWNHGTRLARGEPPWACVLAGPYADSDAIRFLADNWLEAAMRAEASLKRDAILHAGPGGLYFP